MFPTADQGFSSTQGTLFGFYSIQIVFDACNIYPHHASTNANDKMAVKDYIFLQNIMHTMKRKYSNINCAEWWILAKRCRISIVRYRICTTRSAGSKIRWDPPPQFNLCTTAGYCGYILFFIRSITKCHFTTHLPGIRTLKIVIHMPKNLMPIANCHRVTHELLVNTSVLRNPDSRNWPRHAREIN